MGRRIAAVLALAILTAAVAHAADPRAVLGRFLARVAATPLRDLTIEQDLTVFNPDGRTPYASGTQRVVFKVPDRQRVEHTIEGRSEVRLTVGTRAWRRGADGAVTSIPSDRAQGTALAVPVHRKAEDVLAEWRALGVRDDRSHETRVQGRRVTVVGAQAGERDRPAVWLDEEYGVLRFVGREAGESSVLTDVTFGDHRAIGAGLFFPYRQEVFRAGKLLVRTVVRAVALNTSPPDALFDPASLRAPR